MFREHIDNVVWSLFSIMLDGVDFSVVVRSIVLIPAPHDIEKALRYSASEPVKAHVHGFGCFWNQELVNETMCCGVVDGNGFLGLFVAHFLQCDAEGQCRFAIVEKGCKLGLGS